MRRHAIPSAYTTTAVMCVCPSPPPPPPPYPIDRIKSLAGRCYCVRPPLIILCTLLPDAALSLSLARAWSFALCVCRAVAVYRLPDAAQRATPSVRPSLSVCLSVSLWPADRLPVRYRITSRSLRQILSSVRRRAGRAMNSSAVGLRC